MTKKKFTDYPVPKEIIMMMNLKQLVELEDWLETLKVQCTTRRKDISSRNQSKLL